MLKQKKSKNKILYTGRFLKLMEKDGWEFVERVCASDVVAIIGMTSKNKLVLVEQRRVPVGCQVIELPAGLVADAHSRRDDMTPTAECTSQSLPPRKGGHENPLAAAQRELLEETGYEARHWKIWLESPLNPALSDHTLIIYRASGLKKIETGGGNAEENESIRVHEVPLARAPEWLAAQQKKGVCVDPKVYAALFLLHTEKKRVR